MFILRVMAAMVLTGLLIALALPDEGPLGSGFTALILVFGALSLWLCLRVPRMSTRD